MARSRRGTFLIPVDSLDMNDIPHDRPIMVLTKEEGIWLPVQWRVDRFEVIDGDGSWVEADEVQEWRPAIDLVRQSVERAA